MADCLIWEANYSNALQMESLRGLWKEYAKQTNTPTFANKVIEELRYFPDEDDMPPNGATFILSRKDRMVGAVSLCPLKSNYAYIGMNKYCMIKRLYVQKENQRNGLGNRLIQKCINRATKLKYNRIRIEILPSMGTAKKIFVKKGFVESKSGNSEPDKLYFELNIESKPKKSAWNSRSILVLIAVICLSFIIREAMSSLIGR